MAFLVNLRSSAAGRRLISTTSQVLFALYKCVHHYTRQVRCLRLSALSVNLSV